MTVWWTNKIHFYKLESFTQLLFFPFFKEQSSVLAAVFLWENTCLSVLPVGRWGKEGGQKGKWSSSLEWSRGIKIHPWNGSVSETPGGKTQVNHRQLVLKEENIFQTCWPFYHYAQLEEFKMKSLKSSHFPQAYLGSYTSSFAETRPNNPVYSIFTTNPISCSFER